MRRLRLAATAQRDISSLLEVSQRQFGRAAADRYRALLFSAFDRLRKTPMPPSASNRPFAPSYLNFFHLSQAQPVRTPRKVGRARHFVVYEFDDDQVLVVRVLYDAMDLPGQFEPDV